MSPQVTAAVIAAGGVVLTVIATVAVQISGRRATSEVVDKTLKAQDEHLKTQLEEQRKQLNTTLAAQGEQLDRTLEEQRTRTFNERFATAAGQLGDDRPGAVRLAGVYAMAGLADDWEKNRQTCVDVLCGYLRLPYDPDPGDDAEPDKLSPYRANREVRHTIIRLIGAHLRPGTPVSWQGLDLDFTGVVFDGGDFSRAEFSGGEIYFDGAKFSRGKVYFPGAKFSRGTVNFGRAEFSGGEVFFTGAEFSGGRVDFGGAGFSDGWVDFGGAKFSGGTVYFGRAEFSGGRVNFGGAGFSDGEVSFFRGGFSGARVSFGGARFSGGTAYFGRAEFSRSTVDFPSAEFSGSTVSFGGARFSGGEVDFSDVRDWSVRPAFPWTDTPPPCVKLPKKEDQSQA